MLNNTENSIVPISRFNNGEAGKIFDEVNKSGCKIVVKDNKPICVLISPKEYRDIIETIEDCELIIEAEQRMKNEDGMKSYSMEEIMKKYGITQEELDAMEDVEIEE
ncbi:type II toxin-antitoxin system Phd/YefM family antitoxin [Clostridium sp. P21]|uniref:Type II toxin-antitoxin system Phd/YefM family antitoxin n=1 Tax=Clostridium muellerianum TaxID=2716538 RepID=A0A7Y0HN37_9CLOT|nr:type II toxin-antitoxin system Phd/YefM family antitoxin [Clostridium muellerianum]NMM61188.1 type II toxin-antitoxin system Phd/YefM family antitoxin [Clostridium muellerianum]